MFDPYDDDNYDDYDDNYEYENYNQPKSYDDAVGEWYESIKRYERSIGLD